ncbi:MAG: C1 family peptidase [Acidobacteriota bacterium]|nr:C1 family peptidase [Acidobacteriota bacterium]
MSIKGIGLDQIRRALSDLGDPWEAGVTSMSVLTPEEQVTRLGVTPPPGEMSIEDVARRALAQQPDFKSEVSSDIGIPAEYDLRNVNGKNFTTPIKDQKNCGSCVAFGTVATVESRLKVQRNDANMTADLSEAHLFFCHGRDDGASCSTGWWPQKAFDAFKSKGVADEACYPYDSGLAKQDCSGLCSNWAERAVKITGYTALTNQAAKIKEWICAKGPVCACFIVYQDFFSYKSGVYKHVTGSQSGGHCVTIVGYSDIQKCWICKNSWGTGWGEQGFFRIAYGECGIDSWLNHGVDAIENTGWQTNRYVTGLWAINQDRNAWAHISGLGWRKVSPDNDNIFMVMLAQLIAAKAASRPINFYEQNDVIKQLYVY